MFFRLFQVTIPATDGCIVTDTIVIYMWGEQRFFLEIPLTFQVISPVLECFPSEVAINFCFIAYDYKRKIKLINSSNLHGKVRYTPNKVI